jgi:hypothetical protein
MISTAPEPNGPGTIPSPRLRPDRGHPTLSGWWTPIAALYREVGAGRTSHEVPREC